jgi:hypothetical protein
MDQPTLFISHSHQDIRWRKRIEAMLFRQMPGVEILSDEGIDRGSWAEVLAKKIRIEQSRAVVVLVSPHYVTSKTATEELSRILERTRTSTLQIIPVLVADCKWQVTPLASYQLRDRALSKLRGEELERELDYIVGRIRSVLAGEPQITPAPPSADSSSTRPTRPQAVILCSLTDSHGLVEVDTLKKSLLLSGIEAELHDPSRVLMLDVTRAALSLAE